MYPRIEYKTTKEDFNKLLDASKPTPAMIIGGCCLSSPQENANEAWAALGKKMGFDYQTVKPIEGKSSNFFSAIPTETKLQKNKRIKKENEEKRIVEIKMLKAEIQMLEKRLEQLEQNSREAKD